MPSPHVQSSSPVKLTGICPAAQPYALARLVGEHAAPCWLIVGEEVQQVEHLAEDLAFFHAALGGAPGLEVAVFPESQTDSRDMREAFNAASDRLAVLSRLRTLRGATSTAGGCYAVCTTPAALLQPVPPLEDFSSREIVLTRGQHQSFQALLDLLRSFDYDSEAVCEAPGQYAVRGGIVDIYPVTARQPCRLDFFGDTIDDIRAFDPITQRSADSIEKLTLTAAPQLHANARGSLIDYLANQVVHAALIEPGTIEELVHSLAPEGGAPRAPLATLASICTRCFGIADLDLASKLFDSAATEQTWDTESLSHHRSAPAENLLAHERLQAEEEARRQFFEKIVAWQRGGYAIGIVTAKKGDEQRIREIIAGEPAWADFQPRYLRGTLNEGLRITFRNGGGNGFLTDKKAVGLVVVTETEIFGRRRPRRLAGRHLSAAPSQIDQLLDFSELVEGDFVVHLQHGIAIYRGLNKLETAEGLREVISLEFEGRVTLHVPLPESHLISRYVGLTKTKPQLGKVGSGRWNKVRLAAERATLDLAAELLEIQARRESQPGHAFAADTAWQKEFEAAFPFVETRDQGRAIDEVKLDLERTRPMDRLLCGDVGYGKTEVAIRAAFKSVNGGKQVAVLVPTTVLAQQHLNTFRERMAGYPIVVEMISRFRSRTEQHLILTALAEGKVDILIGTHRLLQDDVRFKDLGLVVVDEEQRFGVRHKQVFKRWRAHVDMLSMSATPIPRTLYLALTGARDLSVIETPPSNRLPIQTVVKSYDENLVVEAIRHEVRRGGQVFYLHNRVSSIELVARRLGELLPSLKIGIGHGQMKERELERIMTEFVAGQYHVLVCTTIIESGLDIPNCNTLIIEGADRFGLAQLYQLRGRVGRFKHQAYAYLLLHRHSHLLGLARQRLSAIRQHSQLGAGFRIALRDLELRGAGNLLGPEQSGHIVGVGFELYCQLLRQSVARLKGEKQAATIRATVKLDFVFVGESGPDSPASPAAVDSFTALRNAERVTGSVPKLQARLPAKYIGETRLRIDFYRRLAMAETPGQVKKIGDELRDRFGKPSMEVRALLLVTEIRCRAEQKKLLSVETDGNRLKCRHHTAGSHDYIQYHHRFPRLTAPTPLARLKEIIIFLQNLPQP
ncbi:MAG: transcription-repair coupling factor [Opitutaceae bacterium]|nr:transcription-repair coupling factor [Opitutaceae bacterium]